MRPISSHGKRAGTESDISRLIVNQSVCLRSDDHAAAIGPPRRSDCALPSRNSRSLWRSFRGAAARRWRARATLCRAGGAFCSTRTSHGGACTAFCSTRTSHGGACTAFCSTRRTSHGGAYTAFGSTCRTRCRAALFGAGPRFCRPPCAAPRRACARRCPVAKGTCGASAAICADVASSNDRAYRTRAQPARGVDAG
jgi:hypothetical protein